MRDEKAPRGRYVKKTSKNTMQNESIFSTRPPTPISHITINLEDDDQPEVKMEVFGKVTIYIAPCLVLITPNCRGDFPEIMEKLKSLAQNYDKQSAVAFIQENMKEHNIYNISNLESINDDEFWNLILPQLIHLLVGCLGSLCTFKLLLAKSNDVAEYTRFEIFLLLISMFLGIMPQQPHEQCVTYGELMTFRDNEQNEIKAPLRRQKLMCVLAYFKIMIRAQGLFKQSIRIHRAANKNLDYLDFSKNNGSVLRKATVSLDDDGKIEDYCSKAIMVNPVTNKCVGANSIKNGVGKQDLLFSIYPQLVMIKLLCPQLQDYEAIVFYGARRFSTYNGQRESFEFAGEYPQLKRKTAQKSVMVCIDAAHYGKMKHIDQYSLTGLKREVNKAFVGFNATNAYINDKMAVCTGKWGCGINGGDEVLKFLVQWIACSQAKRDMVYVVPNQQKMKEYQLMADELSSYNTLELIQLLCQYFRVRPKMNTKNTSLLDFLKYYA